MAPEDVETLRRRLYAPGASAADVERYRGLERPAPGAVPATPEQASEPPHRRAGPPRFVLPVVAVVVLAAVVVGIGVARAATRVPDPPVAPTALAMSAADRTDVADEFAGGNEPGIAAFLVTHPPIPGLEHATRFFTIEHVGTGSGKVELHPGSAEAFRGRATVLLVLQRSGAATWTAFRRVVDAAGAEQLVPQRERGGVQAADVLTADTFRYASGDRPVELRVQAPAGERWGVAVVFTD